MEGPRFREIVCLLVLFPAFAGIGGCGLSDRKVEVSVLVDFGPAERPQAEKTVALPEMSTVFDALRVAFQVATSGR